MQSSTKKQPIFQDFYMKPYIFQMLLYDIYFVHCDHQQEDNLSGVMKNVAFWSSTEGHGPWVSTVYFNNKKEKKLTEKDPIKIRVGCNVVTQKSSTKLLGMTITDIRGHS